MTACQVFSLFPSVQIPEYIEIHEAQLQTYEVLNVGDLNYNKHETQNVIEIIKTIAGNSFQHLMEEYKVQRRHLLNNLHDYIVLYDNYHDCSKFIIKTTKDYVFPILKVNPETFRKSEGFYYRTEENSKWLNIYSGLKQKYEKLPRSTAEMKKVIIYIQNNLNNTIIDLNNYKYLFRENYSLGILAWLLTLDRYYNSMLREEDIQAIEVLTDSVKLDDESRTMLENILDRVHYIQNGGIKSHSDTIFSNGHDDRLMEFL